MVIRNVILVILFCIMYAEYQAIWIVSNIERCIMYSRNIRGSDNLTIT